MRIMLVTQTLYSIRIRLFILDVGYSQCSQCKYDEKCNLLVLWHMQRPNHRNWESENDNIKQRVPDCMRIPKGRRRGDAVARQLLVPVESNWPTLKDGRQGKGNASQDDGYLDAPDHLLEPWDDKDVEVQEAERHLGESDGHLVGDLVDIEVLEFVSVQQRSPSCLNHHERLLHPRYPKIHSMVTKAPF
jgi:hypothetical protein